VSHELHIAGHEVRAVSIGGVETCIELPSMGLCFDIGRCPPTAVRQRTVLVTHAHGDHLGGLVHHISLRSLWGMSPSRIVVPRAILEPVEELLALWRRLCHGTLPCTVIPADPHVPVELSRSLSAVPLKASHRVPTLAYVLVQTREKLLDELVGLPGPEIGRMRAAGEPITRLVTIPEVAFSADTRPALLDREPLMRAARLLIVECTFVGDEQGDDATTARADRTGHIQLSDLEARAEALENEAILLTHFSERYDPKWIRARLDALPAGLRERVTPLLS
jgi:ribonuclease Z